MKTQTFNWKQIVTASTMISLASGCAPTGFQASTASQDNKSASVSAESCVPDATDYNLNLNVYAFEMTDSTGVNFGFNALSGLLKAIGLGVNVSSGSLSMSMSMVDPLKQTAIPVTGSATLSSSSFNFNIDAGIVSVGANTAATTSLTNLTKAGVQNILSTAATASTANIPTWSTHVRSVDDSSHFTIPTGSLAGIRVGDEFNIYNYEYFWTGTPCASALDHAYKTSTTPIAKGIVWSVDLNSATLLLEGTATMAVAPGAEVEAANLPQTSSKDIRALKRAVRISSVTQSSQLVITGVGTVDLTTYINNQMPTLLMSSQFWQVQ